MHPYELGAAENQDSKRPMRFLISVGISGCEECGARHGVNKLSSAHPYDPIAYYARIAQALGKHRDCMVSTDTGRAHPDRVHPACALARADRFPGRTGLLLTRNLDGKHTTFCAHGTPRSAAPIRAQVLICRVSQRLPPLEAQRSSLACTVLEGVEQQAPRLVLLLQLQKL